MERKRPILPDILALFFFAAMIFGVCRIYESYAGGKKEIELHESLLRYKPEPEASGCREKGVSRYREAAAGNSIFVLRQEHPDVVGWLTIPNTGIDYPFVRSGDNEYYLSHDIEGNPAIAGSLFMDSRCHTDLSSQNTIIHGHNMKSGGMFGTLGLFGDRAFFDENAYGAIYLPDGAVTLEFFAFMVVNAETEKEAYRISLSDGYYDYVSNNARHFRDIQLRDSDSILTLSTCSYEFDNARMVLLARITPAAVSTGGAG